MVIFSDRVQDMEQKMRMEMRTCVFQLFGVVSNSASSAQVLIKTKTITLLALLVNFLIIVFIKLLLYL